MDVVDVPGTTGAVEIGRGGFGVVYRARELDLQRVVAVKVLPPLADDDGRARFDRERRALGAVSHHPNIVTVYRSGHTDAREPYLVMEFCGRGSLADEVIRNGPLGWQRAVEITVKLAGALETAHRAGIIHRDLKPGNVLVSTLGEPVLADFGIARVDGAAETRGQYFLASLAHVAPEILDGSSPDRRSDVYSLASTCYELITGAAPFEQSGETSVFAMLRRIERGEVPPLAPELVPEPVATVITSALARSVNDRPASALDLARLLTRAQRRLGLSPTRVPLEGDATPASPSARSSATTAVGPHSPTPSSTRSSAAAGSAPAGLTIPSAAGATSSGSGAGGTAGGAGPRSSTGSRQVPASWAPTPWPSDGPVSYPAVPGLPAGPWPGRNTAPPGPSRGPSSPGPSPPGPSFPRPASVPGGAGAAGPPPPAASAATAPPRAAWSGNATVPPPPGGGSALVAQLINQHLQGGPLVHRAPSHPGSGTWPVPGHVHGHQPLPGMAARAARSAGRRAGGGGAGTKGLIGALVTVGLMVVLGPFAVLAAGSGDSTSDGGVEIDVPAPEPAFDEAAYFGHLEHAPPDEQAVLSITELADGRLATAGEDGTIHIWSTALDEPADIVGDRGGSITAALPDGSIVSAEGRLINVWSSTAPSGQADTYLGHEQEVTGMAVLEDGRVISSDFGGVVHLWDPLAPDVASQPLADRGDGPVAVLPDGRVATAHGADVLVWDPALPDVPPAVFDLHSGPVTAMAVLPDGRVVSADTEGALLEWDPGVPAPVIVSQESVDRAVTSIAVLPDGGGVILADGTTTVQVWEPGSSPDRRYGRPQEVDVVTVLSDGRIVSAGPEGVVDIWML